MFDTIFDTDETETESIDDYTISVNFTLCDIYKFKKMNKIPKIPKICVFLKEWTLIEISPNKKPIAFNLMYQI